MGNFFKIEIDKTSDEQSEILIAELSEINFYAFEEEENSISAFIREKDYNEEKLIEILSAPKISYKKSIIKNTNWNAKWESEFEPVIVDNFVAVRASFHKAIENVKFEIIITPKMSFGTGHHPTTYLMIQQMQHIPFTGKQVLDFGTGTGILAILAKRLGAAKVMAIDIDDWSIHNAKENFVGNGCDDIVLMKKEDLNDLEKVDIILCNINLNILRSNIIGFKNICNHDSKLLLSGFLESDEKILIKNFEEQNFKCENAVAIKAWGCVLLTNP